MGDGPVLSILKLDEPSRTVWFIAEGKDPNEDPYFRHVYRVKLDGKNLVSLTPDVGDHTERLSPDGKYLVDTYSQPDVPPVSALRDARHGQARHAAREGRHLEARRHGLEAAGADQDDGARRQDRDLRPHVRADQARPGREVPDHQQRLPGPAVGKHGEPLVLGRARRPAGARRARLRGGAPSTAWARRGRSKSFEDAYYGAMGRDNTIPDQIAGMKQLAQKYPYIDIDRAGIWGHSGGGFGTDERDVPATRTSSRWASPNRGNHDQREYEDDWGERYQGLLVNNADGTDNYDAEANQNFAKNLKGHLLLAHGSMDDNVPPVETMLVVDALIKANKEFDMVIIPNVPHGYGAASDWMMRQRWDYFVRWLAGGTPPFWNESSR